MKGYRLKLRDSKTGPRTVWLGSEARELTATLPRRKGVPWLFWNPTREQPIRNVHHHWYVILRRAALTGVRLHDLRHTFASHAATNNETLTMIGRLLGHAKTRSTARYAHLDDDHVLGAAEQIGLLIQRLIT